MKVEDFLSKYTIKQEDIRYPINKVKTYSNYVMLYLEDEKIMISDDDYFAYNIKNNKGLDEKTYNTLKDNEVILKAYRSCLRKLEIKDFSEKQINDFLYRKQLNHKQIKDIIDKLKQYELLDDEKYCINRINSLSESSSYRQIRNKLKNDGINEDIIDKYLIVDEDKEYTKAKHLAEKYLRTIKNKSYNASKAALISKLVNSGYSYNMAKKVSESVNIGKDNEEDLLNNEYMKAYRKYSKKYSDYELRQRIYAYLLNKGFESDMIKNIMEV